MKIKIQSEITSDNLLFFYDENKNLLISDNWKTQNAELFAQVADFLSFPEVKAETGVHVFYAKGQKRFVLAGLGTQKEQVNLRELGGVIGKRLSSIQSQNLDFVLPDESATQNLVHAQLEELIEGVLLGGYSYKEYKKVSEEKEKDKIKLEEIRLIVKEQSINAQVKSAFIKAESTNLARDWGNKPANEMTPTKFGELAKQIGKEAGLKVSSLDEKDLKKNEMNCFLGVSQGSDQPAFLHILEYSSKKKDAETILLVGKGLTFDAGGISLKPSGGMEDMKFDMCGGAAVLAAMRIIGLCKPEVNVVGMIPSSENLINGSALKPGDILTACNGKTVEVVNTDAEGRLILCDSLAYGVKEYKPNAVIDIATLTGGCMVALGSYNSGLMSNNAELTESVKAAGEKSGDSVWHLPLGKHYTKMLKGTYADLTNSAGREASALTAGAFLQEFVGDTAWAHVDIAGTAWSVEHVEYSPNKGASGAGARLLAEVVLAWGK